MTDIVERLRSNPPTCRCSFCTVREEAANEIERLRSLSLSAAPECRAALEAAREWFLKPENVDLNGSDRIYRMVDDALATLIAEKETRRG